MDVPMFALQFNPAEIEAIAARDGYPKDDGPCRAAGFDASKRGY
jgi:hypothetical protein